MTFVPAGYTVVPYSEISTLLEPKTNLLAVAHRYFDGAKPNPLDWQYLTIEQAATDHHRIVTLFKQIYTGVWISTGISKGGSTALFHRRFYPDDVVATIARVAPITFGTEDPRFDTFLEETVGDQTTRDKIKNYQRLLLENRDIFILANKKMTTFSRLEDTSS